MGERNAATGAATTAAFEWRPGMVTTTEDHLVPVGLRPWYGGPPSYDPRPYQWSVCGLTAAAEAEPVGVPCAHCTTWLKARPAVKVVAHARS